MRIGPKTTRGTRLAEAQETKSHAPGNGAPVQVDASLRIGSANLRAPGLAPRPTETWDLATLSAQLARPHSERFDARAEYPSILSVAPTATVAEAEALEALMGRVLVNLAKRLVVRTQVDGALATVELLAHAQAVVERRRPGAIALLGGGLPRDLLGFVGREVHEGIKAEPPRSPVSTLAALAERTEPLDVDRVRGITSDIDILVHDGGVDMAALPFLSPLARSREVHTDHYFERVLIPTSDLQDYEAQMERARKFGGVSLDLLAIDPSGRLGNAGILSPPECRDVLRQWVREGTFEYLEPLAGTPPDANESFEKLVRLPRALAVVPWLRPSPQSEGRLRAALDEAAQGTSTGADWEYALRQFRRAATNGYDGGLNNAWYRADADTLEAAVMRLAERAGTELRERTTLDFVERFDIPATGRPIDPLLAELPAEMWLSNEAFRALTDDGTVYHGTPTIEGALAIGRNGGAVTGGRGRQGANDLRGFYTAGDAVMSCCYSSSAGIVFALDVRDVRLNVLDWRRAERHPVMQRLREEHGEQLPLHLARLGVDVIFRDSRAGKEGYYELLFQNAAALRFPETLQEIARPIFAALLNPDIPVQQRLEVLCIYLRAYPYIERDGFPDLASLKALLEDTKPTTSEEAVAYTRAVASFNERVREAGAAAVCSPIDAVGVTKAWLEVAALPEYAESLSLTVVSCYVAAWQQLTLAEREAVPHPFDLVPRRITTSDLETASDEYLIYVFRDPLLTMGLEKEPPPAWERALRALATKLAAVAPEHAQRQARRFAECLFGQSPAYLAVALEVFSPFLENDPERLERYRRRARNEAPSAADLAKNFQALRDGKKSEPSDQVLAWDLILSQKKPWNARALAEQLAAQGTQDEFWPSLASAAERHGPRRFVDLLEHPPLADWLSEHCRYGGFMTLTNAMTPFLADMLEREPRRAAGLWCVFGEGGGRVLRTPAVDVAAKKAWKTRCWTGHRDAAAIRAALKAMGTPEHL